MDFTHHVTRSLHEEHEAVTGMLGKLQHMLKEQGPDRPPQHDNTVATEALNALIAAVEVEMPRHFDFEERELLPRLAEEGDGDMGALLIEEHEVILPLAKRLAGLARAARADGFGQQPWSDFHRMANELVERLSAHVEKEEMALLPALAEILDEDEDRAIWNRYAMAN